MTRALRRSISVVTVLLLAPLVIAWSPDRAAAAAAAQERVRPERNGVSAFGAATDFGPDGGMRLNRAVIDLAPTPSGNGVLDGRR
jgi:hypothetical protein